MNEWILLILATTIGSIFSLLGGIYLLYGKWGAVTLQRAAVPFAAGALLAAAFLDLLPHAYLEGESQFISMVVLLAFLAFFVLERTLNVFHHHHEDEADTDTHSRRHPALIVIGDTLHNIIDGLAIGAAFLVSPATGVITAIAVAVHEIPQEIGDFGLLLSKGVRKRSVLLINVVSALATVAAAALVYGLGGELAISQPVLLAIIAGFFVYIAASDIIPSIHAEPKRRTANLQTLILILGVIFVGATTTLAHEYIAGSEHETMHEHHGVEDDHSHESHPAGDHDHIEDHNYAH